MSNVRRYPYVDLMKIYMRDAVTTGEVVQGDSVVAIRDKDGPGFVAFVGWFKCDNRRNA